MSKAVYYALFVLCVLISSFAQILLKKAANKGYEGLRIFVNPETVIGYTLLFTAMFAAVMLYRYVELSVGVLLETTGYVFITVLSYLLLKEKVTKKHLLGIGLILLGSVVCII